MYSDTGAHNALKWPEAQKIMDTPDITCFVDCACSGARSSRDRDGGRESAECLQIYAAWSVRKQNEHTEGFLLETCPHYLEFTDEKLKGEQGASYTMMPPLRKQKDTDLLWEGILNGKIDIFSTDHCP